MMRRIAVIALAILLFAVPARAIDIIGGNALYDPVIAGDTAKVERMLATGTYPDASLDDTGKTALIFAAAAGNEEMVALLLKYKAKPDTRDQVGNTALSYAASRGHVEAAEALLKARASSDVENRQGMTPLMIAAQQGHAEMVRLLLSKGADASKYDYTGRTAMMWAEVNRRSAAIAALKQAGVKE
jgi:ankyrin repeat protein